MIRKRLQQLPLDVLESIARDKGIKYDTVSEQEELIEMLLEAFEEEQIERELDNNSPMWVKERKFKILEDQELQTEIEDEYPLVEGYNENRIMVLLRDPSWAFAYWDLKQGDLEEIRDSRPAGHLFLRVYEISGEKLLSDKISDFFDIPLSLKDVSWYINLPQTGVNYCIDLIALFRSGEKTLARSNVIFSPRVELEGERRDDIFFQPDNEAFEKFRQDKEIPQRIISILDNQYIS